MSRHCHECKYSGMDMDMEPYCVNPAVLKDWKYGLVLSSRNITKYCPAPEHPLFEGREQDEQRP